MTNIYYIIRRIRLYIIGLIVSLNRQSSRGQALLEYGIILVVVTGVLMAMQLYVKRGLQGRYKATMDHALRVIAASHGSDELFPQYDPYYQGTCIYSDSQSKVGRSFLPGGESSLEIEEEEVTRTGINVIPPYDEILE